MILAIGALSLLAACVTTSGKKFDPQQAARFVSGQTTKGQVLAVLGQPSNSKTYTLKKDMGGKDLDQPAVMTSIGYHYTDRQVKGQPDGTIGARSASYAFSADKLISWFVFSTFPEDATDFDEELVSKIVKGKTTKQQVIDILGRPAGYGVYPFGKQAQGSVMHYGVFMFRPGVRGGTMKTLSVFLDARDVVNDFDLNIKNR
jgi:outer membrane protein assembly factor BamE (lipoprotein component of BamABCDE complex)